MHSLGLCSSFLIKIIIITSAEVAFDNKLFQQEQVYQQDYLLKVDWIKVLWRTDQTYECHYMIVWIMGSVCLLMFTKWCGWQSVWSSFNVVSVAHGIQIGMILV